MPGERGNWDTGFQEAIPGRERGQGAALQEQLRVSLHGLDWRQTGREQRTRTDTPAGHLDRLRHMTRGAPQDQDVTRHWDTGWGGWDRAVPREGSEGISRSLHTLVLLRPTLRLPDL